MAEDAKADDSARAPLPGKVIGILVGNPGAMLLGKDKVFSEDAVMFVTGKGDFRRVYVSATADSPNKEDLVLPVGKEGKERRRFNSVELLSRPLLKGLGLRADFQLVEMVVNDGAGCCPYTTGFYASKITVLDKTEFFPVELGPQIDKLKKTFAALLSEKSEAINATLNKVQKSVIGDEKPTGPREDQDGILVTWVPESETVRVELTHRVTNSLSWKGSGTKKTKEAPGDLKRGAPSGRPFGITFGVDAKVVYTVTKKGGVSATELTLTPVRINTPPPPSIVPTRGFRG